MLKITDRNWKSFKVKEIFEKIEKCKCNNASKLQDGLVPYVGATNRNNGIMNFVEHKSKIITTGNCIAFICDGQGSVGYSIYKKENFIGSTTVKVGRFKKLNRFIANFLVTALDKNREIYSYGYKRSEPRLKNESIMLPIDENGNPDYDFMERFIKEREELKKQKYINYINEKIKLLDIATPPQKIVEPYAWKDFFIKDLFTAVQRGKRLIKEKQIMGTIPYVSSSAINNGVDSFISNENAIRKFSNCLSLANSGSVGSCFYEPFTFIASDHITHLKNEKYNMNSYLFMATMLKRLSEKYNFNREINDNRISREKIMLPVDGNGNLDVKYMEFFTKIKLKEKYSSYIKYATF